MGTTFVQNTRMPCLEKYGIITGHEFLGNTYACRLSISLPPLTGRPIFAAWQTNETLACLALLLFPPYLEHPVSGLEVDLPEVQPVTSAHVSNLYLPLDRVNRRFVKHLASSGPRF